MARQELKRRFLKVSDTDNEDALTDRLERVLDEEFNHGIIFDDKARGTGKGLGKVLIESGLFNFEDAKLLDVGEDGEITNEEQIKRYGHESAYFALLEMKRERRRKDAGEEDPIQLVFSIEEIEKNFSSRSGSDNHSNRKRKIEGEVMTLGGKQFLFVKATKSPPIEPKLKDYIPDEVDTMRIPSNKKEKREEVEIVESKEVGGSFFSNNRPLRGSYFIFDVDKRKE
eukprot:TRINITY_DN15153_c0_g1_i1.p1 TRINITY_DN15153_c0_g1~~TRINITY_DN15153_c0_g1_i1.p1  ORF type:complete len:227 (-),score=84.52 TRINITY_DN15153_c0_g1_i1:180-860(-)